MKSTDSPVALAPASEEIVIPLLGLPSVSSDCSNRVMFTTPVFPISVVENTFSGVTVALACVAGKLISPIENVTCSPAR